LQSNKRLYLQLLDLALHSYPVSEEKVEEVFDLIKNTDLETDLKQEFSQRRLEFLEDFSSSIAKIMKANEAHSKLYKSKSGSLNGSTTSKKRPSESRCVYHFLCVCLEDIFMPHNKDIF
jgi:hypothetical protein